MCDIQTFTGWTSFEIGRLTPQYDQNFVVYTSLKEIVTGLNCKIRVIDLIESNVYKYLAQGGLCQVVVQGTMHVAPTTEQGWVPTSTSYLHVTHITQEQFDNQRQQQQTDVTALSPQQEPGQQSHIPSPLSQEQRWTTSVLTTTNEEKETEEDEEDDDSDLDYGSFDAEEEEKARLNDSEFDDYNDLMEEDISSEDIDQLNAEANMPLHMDCYVKKRDAEDFLENENNKKQKHIYSSSSCCCCPVVIDLE